MALQHLRSSTASKRPLPGSMSDGQIAINSNTASPGLFFKDSAGALIKVGPVHVGTTAPNASPAAGGATGNTVGEQWLDTTSGTYVFKVWDGSAWRSETGTFVDVNGDTMTGTLVMDNQQQIRFRETTANGTNYIAIQAPASVASDRTLTLPDVSGTIVSTGDTGTVTSTMIADGTIVDADVNASAAIAGTKISPNFGSQNVVTTGTATAAALIPSSSTVPTNGVYLPAANSVAISTNGTGRLFVDASGNVGVNASSPTNIFQVESDADSGQGIWTRNINTGSSAASHVLVNSAAGQLLLRAHSAAHSVWPATALLSASPGLTNGLALNTGTAAPIAFLTNNAERLRITSAGQIQSAGLGSAAAPALSFTTDTNTGLYSPGADQLAISTGGTGRLFVDASGKITNNASNTNASLNIVGTISVGDSNASIYTPTHPINITTDAYSDTKLIRWMQRESSNARAYIGSIGNANFTADLVFGTNGSTSDVAALERLRITSAGRLGVGTTTPQGILDLAGTSRFVADVSGASPRITALNAAASAQAEFSLDGSALVFRTLGADRARIDSSGRLLVGTSSTGDNSKLIVQGNTSTPSGIGICTFANGTATPADGEALGIIRFSASNHVEATAIASARDGGTWTAGSSQPTRLTFSTTSNGASGATPRMTIDSAGRVLVGTNNPVNNTHTFTQSVTSNSFVIQNTLASGAVYGLQIRYVNQDPNNTLNSYLECYSQSSNTLRAEIRSNGGLANYSANNVNLSDRNVKKDIAPAAGTWNCLKEWEVVNFRYKDQPDDSDLNIGVIAQQVAESCPEVITLFQEAKEATEDQPAQEERLGVKDQQMMWMAVKALQEAQLRIETLEAKVAALEAQ